MIGSKFRTPVQQPAPAPRPNEVIAQPATAERCGQDYAAHQADREASERRDRRN